jgi:hypothetical protein
MKPVIKMKGDFKLTDKTGFDSNDGINIRYDFNINIIVVKGNVILR